MSAPPSARDHAEDRRLATLHLRLGGLALARAELEDLHRRDVLDAPGLADLAEARWRSGDLGAAAAAAADHLAAGGTRPIARVIAAEAAAAVGRPTEARGHVDALGVVDATALEQIFAGMPRRAFWPSAPSAPIGPPGTMFEPDPAGSSGRRFPAGVRAQADAPGAEVPATSVAPAGMAGLWGDEEPGDEDTGRAGRGPSRAVRDRVGRAGRAGSAGSTGPAGPTDELARAREELASADAGAPGRGLARLALVLRLDPTLAADVLAALGPRRDATAQLIRGDACRLLGRQLEAEAAFAAAARALDERGHRTRPS